MDNQHFFPNARVPCPIPSFLPIPSIHDTSESPKQPPAHQQTPDTPQRYVTSISLDHFTTTLLSFRIHKPSSDTSPSSHKLQLKFSGSHPFRQVANFHNSRHPPSKLGNLAESMCRTKIGPSKAGVGMDTSLETPDQLLRQLGPDGTDAGCRLAVAKLTEMARTSSGRRNIVNSGGVSRLVGILKGRHGVLRFGAAHALCNIANELEYHNEIVKHGAIKAFVQLLHDGTREGVCAGAVNLANVSRNPHFVKMVLTELGGPRVLAGLLKTWDFCSARDVCADLLVRLSASKSNEMLFVAGEAMEALIAVFLDHRLSIETREKVLTALFNALLNKQEPLEKFVQSGSIPAVIKLLYHASADGKFSALLMMKNLVVNGFEDEVFHNGGVSAIARMFEADLHDLHYTEAHQFQKEVAKTLYELSVGRDDIKQKIIETDVIQKLVPLIDHSSNKLKSATLKVLYGLAVNNSAKVRCKNRVNNN